MNTSSTESARPTRSLLVGFFQTIGDLECLYAVQSQLDADHMAYDIAPFREHVRQAIDGALDLQTVDPGRYTHIYIICGPCSPAFFEKFGIQRFVDAGLVFVGVNLTMVEPLSAWNPFDVLVERDSDRTVAPDLTFSVSTGRVPVISTCFIEGQSEYADRQRHTYVIDTVDEFVNANDIARITLDTRWPRQKNAAGLSSPAEITSALARTDLLITNRLHGLVFALKAGIPVIAIDAVAGGGKVSQQASRLDWPCLIDTDQLSHARLSQAMTWCQSNHAREAVMRSQAIGFDYDHGLDAAFESAYGLSPRPARAPAPTKRSRLRSLVRKVRAYTKR